VTVIHSASAPTPTVRNGKVTTGGAVGAPLPPPPDSSARLAPGPVAVTVVEPGGNTNRTRTLYSVLSQSLPGDQVSDRRATGTTVPLPTDVPLAGAGGAPPMPSAADWPAPRRYATRYVLGVNGSRAVGQLIVSPSTHEVDVARIVRGGPTVTAAAPVPFLVGIPCATVKPVKPAAAVAAGTTRRASRPVV